jgi:hypothetical protein
MKLWLKLLLAGVAVLVAVAGAVVFLVVRGPDLSEYERFREPTFVRLEPSQMLVVETRGVPGQTGAEGIGTLFEIYMGLDGVERGLTMPAPRARWPSGLDVPKEQWVGRWALPVPRSVRTLPPEHAAKAKLERWDYGEVAQILHVGPYSAEKPTVERLHAFITAKGYRIAGPHEEEYLRGPGMFGPGDPERYYTLIRYTVARGP